MSDNVISEIFSCVDNFFSPAVVIDSESCICYFNHSFVTFSKRPPRKLKDGVKLFDILKSKNNDVVELFDKCKEKNQVRLSEEIKIWPEQEEKHAYVVVVKIIPHEVGKKQYYIVNFNDLSVEKNLYDKYRDQISELKDTHAQIVQADKLATLGEITASISHEINNPLTIASGNTELLQIFFKEKDLNSQKDAMIESADSIFDSLNRISNIVNNMKNFLHKSEDKKEYCNLEKIIDNSINLVKTPFNNHEVTLSKNIMDTNLVGFVNKLKMEQVLVNLFKNALDAISENNTSNGRVTVTLGKEEDSNYVNITVSDNGPGISQDLHQEIFTAFYTSKEVGKGTGLGLYICTKIVNAMQGQIFLESEPNKGTSFRIQLPIIEVSSYAHNDKMLKGVLNKDGKRILVVDDEVEVLNVINKFIEQSGHVFIGSTNGHDALKVLKDIHIDLIITDYNMPQMNGSQFAELIRSSKIKCPIFYLTSIKNIDKYDEDKDKYNVSGLILKPFTFDEVRKTIGSILDLKEKK